LKRYDVSSSHHKMASESMTAYMSELAFRQLDPCSFDRFTECGAAADEWHFLY